MKQSSPVLFTLAVFLFFVSHSNLLAQNCENPNSTFEFVGNVSTYFCEGPDGVVTVDITVDENNDPACINYMALDWDDGTVLTLGPNDFGNYTHYYDFEDSIACDLSPLDLNPLVTLTLVFKNGKVNVRAQSLSITLLPRAEIRALPPFCVGEPVEFGITDSCYVTSVEWDFGGGQTSTSFNPLFTWNTPGLKLVELCVFNDCGSTCSQRYFNIREKPTIDTIEYVAVPPSGCYPVDVTLEAEVDEVDDYDWAVVSPAPCFGCYQFLPATATDSVEPVIRFLEEGVYDVQLIGSNPCGKDTFITQVQIFAPPSLTLAAPPPACKTLSYTPDVNYLNSNPGSITSYQWTFPKGVPTTSNLPNPTNIQYENNGDTLLTDVVQLTVSGPCGSQTYNTTVQVYGNTEVQFGNIGQVCTGDEPFIIPVTPPPPVGTFSFSPNLPGGSFDPATGLLNPASLLQGNYSVTYVVSVPGAPAGCQSQGAATFTVVPSVAVSIAVPDKLCVDAPLQSFTSDPTTGGTWGGDGITNTTNGQYDPAQAGVGFDTVSFSLQNPSGCISKTSGIIEIIGIPQVTPPDTVFTCHIPQGINLESIGNFTFSPADGDKTWGGTGVNPQTGVFTSPGIGTYNLTLNYDIDPACDTTVNFVVQVNAFVAAAAGANDTVCQSQVTHTLTGTPGGGDWSGPGIAPATGEINLALAGAGTHTYTYVISGNTPCESSDAVQITVFPGDGVSIVQTLDYVCETAATYTLPIATPLGGIWTDSLGQPVPGGIVNVAVLNPDIYVYTYTVPDLPDACNNLTFTLNVAPQPSAGFALMPDTACIGETVTVVPIATTGVQYQVNWGDTNSGSALSHTYAGAGDFQVALTVNTQHPLTGATLCSNNSTENIHIIAPPELLQFSMNQDTGCAPLFVIFENESIAENGEYVWQFGNFFTYEGQEPPNAIEFAQGLEDTTYVVTLTVKTGCDSMAFSRTVTVLPQPRADFGITYDEPCSGGILEINNTSTGNPANNSWATSTGLAFNSFNPPLLQFFTNSLPLIVDISLTVSNQCGTDSITKSVTVNPTDVVALINISDTTEVCVGDTVMLTSFSTPGAPIHWQLSDGNTFLQNSIKVSFPEDGIYKVTLYAEGCGYDSMAMYVRVHPLPTLTVKHPPIICPGDTATFTVLTDAPGSLLHFGTGDSSDLKTANYRYLQSGIFPLSAIATSLVGCKKTWNGSIEIAPKPEALAQVPDSVCSRAPVLFNSVSASDLTCIWNFGDDNSSDDCAVIHIYQDPGLYTAALTVISPIGCRDTAFAPVYVRATPVAVPIFQYLERCTPAQVLFSSQSVGATGLQWDFGDGTTATVSSFTKNYAAGGVYQVRLIATNEGICSDSGEVAVELWQTPLFDFELLENCTVAAGTDLSINTDIGNLPTVTGPSYEQDGNFHAGLEQGYYEVFIVSPEGCENDTTVFIPKPLELLLQVAEDSFAIRLGETIQLDAIVNQLGASFQWSPDRWLESDTLADPVAEPHRDITYYVVATALNGCTKSDTVFVAVQVERDSGLYIPEAFTPNDDGINDIFYVRSINPSVDFIEDFRVLDKYGEIVHFVEKCPAEQVVYGWDGKFKGEKAEMGIYRWQLLVAYKDGVKTPKSGFLMLAR
jgi:gliding motility-associated-like protein